MKLQIAIDRVTLSKAEEMAKIFAGKTDIIEMGDIFDQRLWTLCIKEIK